MKEQRKQLGLKQCNFEVVRDLLFSSTEKDAVSYLCKAQNPVKSPQFSSEGIFPVMSVASVTEPVKAPWRSLRPTPPLEHKKHFDGVCCPVLGSFNNLSGPFERSHLLHQLHQEYCWIPHPWSEGLKQRLLLFCSELSCSLSHRPFKVSNSIERILQKLQIQINTDFSPLQKDSCSIPTYREENLGTHHTWVQWRTSALFWCQFYPKTN